MGIVQDRVGLIQIDMISTEEGIGSTQQCTINSLCNKFGINLLSGWSDELSTICVDHDHVPARSLFWMYACCHVSMSFLIR